METNALNLDKLKADMAAHVETTSARQFSLAVTNGRNQDWYRNFLDGVKKRPTADAFLGIVRAMGRDPVEYMLDYEPTNRRWPSVSVLTQTFAALLESVGVPAYEDERAHKLAQQFPNALRSVEHLVATLASDARAIAEEPDDDLDAPPLQS